ncbi:hypothetical protein [Algoriphagus hitonicola]|uniref:Uncharacterized protein n=1 Tax=Algoriphagus hitonicola TaxID=435880 RepID=A0A1I2UEL7_9BACT|nr:hypothetical protein [Algoriphagus hitonicola]SFG75614.1 hypothetical protein SAMN04487988_107209 [Algoriphagus hitonicola]
MDLRIFVLVGIVSCSWIVTSYYDFAIQQGLPIGKFFLPDNGKNFKLFTIIAGIYFTIAGAIDFGWYFFLIIPVVSFLIAFILTRMLGKRAQIVGPIGFVLLVITNVLVQIELINI